MKKSLHTLTSDRDTVLCAAVLLMVWALYAVLSQLTPFLFDNIAFDAFYLGFNGGKDNFDAEALMRYAGFMRDNDNWRLANIVAPLTTVVLDCKPVFSVLTGICVACMVLVPTAECVRGRRFVSAVALWAGFTLFLPWRNNILTGDYSLNYIYGAALCMLLLCLVFRMLRKPTPPAAVAMLALSAVVAVWHEGFSVTTGAALVAYIVIWRKGRAPWSVWACAVLLLGGGLAWAMASALSSRAGVETSQPSIMEAPVKALAFNALTLLLVAAVAVAALSRRLRRSLLAAASRPAFVIFALTAVAACVLSLMVKQAGRTAFWPQACALAAWVLWMQEWWRGRHPKSAASVAGVVALLLVAQGVYAAVYVKKSADEYYDVLDRMATAGSGATVYFDITMPEAYPAATLGMPVRSVWIEPFTFGVLDLRYPGLCAAVVPSALEHVDEARADDLGQARRLGDALFSTPDADRLTMDRAMHAYLDLRLADGTVLCSHPAFSLLFTSPGGHWLLYLKPFNISASDVAAVEGISY